jgi:hypothetical protein
VKGRCDQGQVALGSRPSPTVAAPGPPMVAGTYGQMIMNHARRCNDGTDLVSGFLLFTRLVPNEEGDWPAGVWLPHCPLGHFIKQATTLYRAQK